MREYCRTTHDFVDIHLPHSLPRGLVSCLIGDRRQIVLGIRSFLDALRL